MLPYVQASEPAYYCFLEAGKSKRFLIKNKKLYSWYIKQLELHVCVSSLYLPSPTGMKQVSLEGGWQWAVLQEGNIESGELATL